MGSRKRSISSDPDMHALHKELDEASCPICMDHPHNAVLLVCSSHDKGCRSYICDTSYRHSNCLDRFKKLRDESSDDHITHSLNPRDHHGYDTVSYTNWNLGASAGRTRTQEGHDTIDVDSTATEGLGSGRGGAYARGVHMGVVEENVEVPDSSSLREVLAPEENNLGNSSMSNLKCPLCRGSILGWKIVEEARRYLDLKRRSCSRESCLFGGNYRALRRHARRVHPAARPADVDPSRQQAWHRLQNQREYDDIVSAIRSAMPDAIVFGDYVIEGGDRPSGDRGRAPGDNGRPLSTLFLFQMIGSMDSPAEPRGGRSVALSRRRSSSAGSSRRRYLWGENLLGLQVEDTDDDDDDLEVDAFSDTSEGAPRRQRRRRLINSRDEDQQQ